MRRIDIVFSSMCMALLSSVWSAAPLRKLCFLWSCMLSNILLSCTSNIFCKQLPQVPLKIISKFLSWIIHALFHLQLPFGLWTCVLAAKYISYHCWHGKYPVLLFFLFNSNVWVPNMKVQKIILISPNLIKAYEWAMLAFSWCQNLMFDYHLGTKYESVFCLKFQVVFLCQSLWLNQSHFYVVFFFR